MAKRKYGGTVKDVSAKSKNTNQRQAKTNTGKTVYETVTIPLPVWVKVGYDITVRTEYQQQLNELINPFFTIAGNSRMPKRIENAGHFYEVFIDGSFSNASNKAALGMNQRNYQTSIKIEVLGYLVGEGENQEKPRIVRRENAVEFKMGRERTVVGDIPYSIKDGFYRE